MLQKTQITFITEEIKTSIIEGINSPHTESLKLSCPRVQEHFYTIHM